MHQFSESGFKNYSTREQVTRLRTKVEYILRDLEAKLNISKALDRVGTHFLS